MAKPQANIEIRLKTAFPEQVAPSHLSELIQCLRALVLQQDVSTEEPGAEERDDSGSPPSFAVLGLRRGSTTVQCLSRDVSAVQPRIVQVGAAIDKLALTPSTIWALQPIQRLATLASRYQSGILIRNPESGEMLLAIEPDTDYSHIADRLIGSGNVTTFAFIERVGGAVQKKAGVRIAGRTFMLFCDVATDDVARELGRLLYSDVVLSGHGSWFTTDNALQRLRIDSVRPVPQASAAQAFSAIREAAPSLGRIKDPTTHYARMRK